MMYSHWRVTTRAKFIAIVIARTFLTWLHIYRSDSVEITVLWCENSIASLHRCMHFFFFFFLQSINYHGSIDILWFHWKGTGPPVQHKPATFEVLSVLSFSYFPHNNSCSSLTIIMHFTFMSLIFPPPFRFMIYHFDLTYGIDVKSSKFKDTITISISPTIWIIHV